MSILIVLIENIILVKNTTPHHNFTWLYFGDRNCWTDKYWILNQYFFSKWFIRFCKKSEFIITVWMCHILPSSITIPIWYIISKMYQLNLMVDMGYIWYYLGYKPVHHQDWYKIVVAAVFNLLDKISKGKVCHKHFPSL